VRSAAAIGVAALVAAALAGCGGGELSGAQREHLEGRIAAAKRAAAARDGDGVRAALVRFRSDVRELRDAGALSDEDADRLLTGALAASRRARAELAPPAPTATATPAPTATAAPPKARPPGKAKGKKHGKGHKKP
jgi:hypothetical protein